MSTSARLALPYIAAAQAQKHVTHNEALEKIDALVHLALESRAVAAPPATPEPGARYLVPTGATGAWAGRTGAVAVAQDGGWAYHAPRAGWRAFVRDEALLVLFDGTAWAPLVRRAASFGINAEADATNRLAVSAPAALFTHAGADMRVVVNKAAATDVGTLQFQTGYATQAEIGLSGDNDLRVKVRSGAALRQAFVVKGGTNRVGIGVAEPAAELEVADTSGDGDCRIQLRANASQVAQLGVSSTQVFLDTVGNKPFIVYVGGTASVLFSGNGNVGIGVSTPTARLDVAGAIKAKAYSVSTLPTAGDVGAGAIIYVSNESGGAVMAFSDGTAWRRMTDRAVVS